MSFSRSINPMTGDLEFDSSRRSWKKADSPIATSISLCLRTTKGTAGRDSQYGLDTSQLQNATDNAGTIAKMAIESALDRFVKRQIISNLAVTVDTSEQAAGIAVVAEIAYKDSSGLGQKIKLSL